MNVIGRTKINADDYDWNGEESCFINNNIDNAEEEQEEG